MANKNTFLIPEGFCSDVRAVVKQLRDHGFSPTEVIVFLQSIVGVEVESLSDSSLKFWKRHK